MKQFWSRGLKSVGSALLLLSGERGRFRGGSASLASTPPGPASFLHLHVNTLSPFVQRCHFPPVLSFRIPAEYLFAAVERSAPAEVSASGTP